MRPSIVLLVLLAAFAPPALADGDPASDTLVFRDYFLPYAPATSPEAKAAIDAATTAAAAAQYPIKVAVIAGGGDLGVVPQFADRPADYATFLGQELKFTYKGVLVIVMPTGYGLNGPADAAVKAAVGKLAKPKSADPTDLTVAAVDAVKAIAAAAGHPLDIKVPTVTVPVAPESGGSSNTTVIALVAGGSAALLVLLGGLFWWIRRAPADPDGDRAD